MVFHRDRFLAPCSLYCTLMTLQAAINGSNLQLYADDSVIHAAEVSPEEAMGNLQPSLNRFTRWCRANKLSLNATKTKLTMFGTRYKIKKAKEVNILVEGVTLQIVQTYKYLGITLDSTLTFNYHVRTVTNMISYKANLLAKVRKFLHKEVAIKIYKSMILPYFDYGDVIYGSASQESLDKLQRLQNR